MPAQEPEDRVDRTLAVRHDRVGAYEERIDHFAGSDGTEIIGILSVPQEPSVCIVLCPSIHASFLEQYRHAVLLSRALARSGVAVQRFHYRGMGNSGDPVGETTFDGLVQDARAAADHLRASVDVPLAYGGFGFGALVAGASSGPRDPLVLWEPVIDGKRYFREAIRSGLVAAMKDKAAPADRAGSRLGPGEDDWPVEVLGWEIHRALHDSSVGVRLGAVLGARRSVLVIHTDRDVDASGRYAEASRLEAGGSEVDAMMVDVSAGSWLVSDAWAEGPSSSGASEIGPEVAAWLRARLDAAR